MQTQVFAPRLGKDENNHILVVYDPDQRYRQICLDMASESRQLVDASESSIISRAQGITALVQPSVDTHTVRTDLVEVRWHPSFDKLVCLTWL